MNAHNKQNLWVFFETTYDISVTVIPEFYSEGSNKEQNTFIWVYNVKIENFSSSTIQMIGRKWQIFDSTGRIEEINGTGLVGQQPIIKPNELFEYASQVRLFSDSGLMRGEYFALDLTLNKELTINIPAFSLDSSTENKGS